MEQHRTPARAIRFYRVLGSLSSCDHLDLKNLLVLERRMARPQGAGILADRTACKALDPNCNKVRPSISPYGASTCVWCWTSNLSPTTHLIPFPFFFCFYISFLPIQVGGITSRPPGGNPTMILSLLAGDSSVSTQLFPVSWLVCWGFIQHFLSKRSLCHKTTVLVAH